MHDEQFLTLQWTKEEEQDLCCAMTEVWTRVFSEPISPLFMTLESLSEAEFRAPQAAYSIRLEETADKGI